MSKLPIATEGCCKEHPCDNCKTCQSGRCCRKDNPDYKLPGLGEWDGPIYGEMGVLNDDGEKVECHCCGEWFGGLQMHAWKAHDLTADEYKAIFGLSRRHGLIGPTTLVKRQAGMKGVKLVAPYISSEQRSYNASIPRRPEAGRRIRNMARGNTRTYGKKFGGSSQYHGVFMNQGMWQATLTYKRNNYYLGLFDNEKDAAYAYDAKAREVVGDLAKLNFPDEYIVPDRRKVPPMNRPNKTGFRGVYRDGMKFYAEIQREGIRSRLGPFLSVEEAARAYDAKARELYGDKARLNFLDDAVTPSSNDHTSSQ